MISKKSKNDFEDRTLEKEAVLFARYLLDSNPPQEMIDRYKSANEQLGVRASTAADEQVLSFSVSHPWSIPYLDAATGLLMNDSLLRKKIYVMAAVLEASPRYAKDFLPENRFLLMVFVQLIGSGLIAGIKMLIGIPLFLVIRRRNND